MKLLEILNRIDANHNNSVHDLTREVSHQGHHTGSLKLMINALRRNDEPVAYAIGVTSAVVVTNYRRLKAFYIMNRNPWRYNSSGKYIWQVIDIEDAVGMIEDNNMSWIEKHIDQRNYDRPPTMAEMRKHLYRGTISGEIGKGPSELHIDLNVDIYRLKSGGLRVELGKDGYGPGNSYSHVNSADFGSMLSSLQTNESEECPTLRVKMNNYYSGFWKGDVILHVDSCDGIPKDIVDELLVHAVKTAMRGKDK